MIDLANPYEFNRRNYGELWQYLDTVAFTISGTIATVALSSKELCSKVPLPIGTISAIAVSIFSYMVGRAVYWAIQSLFKRVELYPKPLATITKLATTILASTVAGWLFLNYFATPVGFGPAFAIAYVAISSGYTLRELSCNGINQLLARKFNQQPGAGSAL